MKTLVIFDFVKNGLLYVLTGVLYSTHTCSLVAAVNDVNTWYMCTHRGTRTTLWRLWLDSMLFYFLATPAMPSLLNTKA